MEDTLQNPVPPADDSNALARKFRRRRLVVGLVALVLLVGALGLWLRPTPTLPPPVLDTDDSDIKVLLAVANPGYMGIGVCAECHAERAAEFKTTRHYVACTPASGVTAKGFAPGKGRFDSHIPGLHYEMMRSGTDFIATAVDARDGREKRVPYKIGLVYGSANKTDEMYFAWEGDRLFHLPVGWLTPHSCWGAGSDTIKVIDGGPSCLQCHNTWMAHKPETTNQYHRDFMLLGVTCERCHGPGKEHVEHHRKHPEDAAHGILHPGTLSRERLTDICAQCHANTRMTARPYTFRPGEPLETAYRIVKAKYREDETTTNQVQDLADSKCFQKGDMTCITCHSPHFPKRADKACIKCHTDAPCKDHPTQPEAVRDKCAACHMPRQIWMNSHFFWTKDEAYLPVGTRSEHRIAIYPEAKKAVLLGWLRTQADDKSKAEAERLEAELAAHWRKEGEKLSKAKRFKAAIGAYREALHVKADPKVREEMQEAIARQGELDDLFAQLRHTEGRVDKAVDVLTKILRIKPDDTQAHEELGNIYSGTDRPALAIPHLEAIAKHDPGNAAGLTRLAWMTHIEGRPQRAAELCSQADKVEPGHPGNHFVWGMALLEQRLWADAEKKLRHTLKSDPAHASANQALSMALRQQGQAKEAVLFAKRAVHFSDKQNPEPLLVLADAYAAAEQAADARKTLERALGLARLQGSPLEGEIRRRLEPRR